MRRLSRTAVVANGLALVERIRPRSTTVQKSNIIFNGKIEEVRPEVKVVSVLVVSVAAEVVGVTAAATAAAVRRGRPNDPLQNQRPHPQKQLQQGHPIEESHHTLNGS